MAKNNLKNKKYIFGLVILIFLIVLIVVVILKRDFWRDWYRGLIYNPTTEMMGIREKLKLTGDGEFLFNAVQPVLNEADDFNKNCRKDGSEVAVLGCYDNENIYIYNIVDEELDGIRELTTAHELLHAMWARMDLSEKEELEPILRQVYNNNLDILEEDIATYSENEKVEEIFVRAGTEIRTLPSELEKYYAKVFENRDSIVDFYEGYIKVFREIKSEMEKLDIEIGDLANEIFIKTAEYEKKFNQLEADIISFNSCAEIVGCFKDEGTFYAKREQLLIKQNELNLLNEEINNLIDKYNEKVELYNADVTESVKLQDMINSNKKVEDL